MFGNRGRLALGLSCIFAFESISEVDVNAQGPLSLRPTPQESSPPTSSVNAGTNNPLIRTPATSARSGSAISSRNLLGGSSRSASSRVARAPNMFGDTLPPLISFRTRGGQGSADFPREAYQAPLGGGGSYNIAENNSAVPVDRVYFVYNGFFNAISSSNGFGPASVQSIDLHRYVAGLEKTFLDGNMSIDVRMPLLSGFNLNNSISESELGNVGNLTMFLKGLVYGDEDVAFSTGLGIGLPTGSDLRTRTVAPFANEFLTVRNQGVRLIPFVAGTMNLSDKWFLQSFGQMNFAASGNDVVNQNGVVGVFNEQNLLQTDIGVGRWIWQDSQRPVFTGLAGIFELHYTTTINDTDRIGLGNNSFLVGELSNSANRQDLLNLTSGVQAQLGPLSALRVGAVVPLRDTPDRVFDSEVQVSFNRRF
jgi:hypothetical protein